MTVAVTGHRPDKLYGYNMSDPRYMLLMSAIKGYLRKTRCTRAISGMALGTDLIFAIAVLELKKEGMDISLTCAVPCRNHKAKWKKSAWTEKYDEILKEADEVVLVSDMPYNQFVMQQRNQWMVDRCDELLAVFDGSPGGTKNCIDYAASQDKKITVLFPDTSSPLPSLMPRQEL